MADPFRLTVEDIALFERDVVFRMPFRFGIVTLQCAPDGGSGPITAQRRSAISYAVVRRRLDAVLRTGASVSSLTMRGTP